MVGKYHLTCIRDVLYIDTLAECRRDKGYTQIITIRLLPTRLDEIMAKCSRGRVTIIIGMSQTHGIGHSVTGHRRGDSNIHTSASDEVRALHDWAPTRQKSSPSSTYPVGHTNMTIVYVTGYRRYKATGTIIFTNITMHTDEQSKYDDDHQRRLIGGIP
jgi:hypothetical protein